MLTGYPYKSNSFARSEVGAQSAWKGYSSQTLYIASRIASDANNGYDFFPEDVEDLIIKKDGAVLEAVQIKNISSDLTLSSLASTRSSQRGEGFFKRMCELHASHPYFSKVRVVYFNEIGKEINGFLRGNEGCRKSILEKLVKNHDVPPDCAEWLLTSLIFEKVSVKQLQSTIADQLKDCVAVMSAPDLAQTLLVQHVSDLSEAKGRTNLGRWQEQIYQIGNDIAAVDGYYKEYQKSLLRLCDLTLDKELEQLRSEFEEGVSVHPAHIRSNLDIHRTTWLKKIVQSVAKGKAVIVKGVSGQGKSALCYRYLINNHPEQLVFCVRRVESARQAENLAVALKGIAKHTHSMIVYIDVNPGDQKWVLLIQELQMRGVHVPLLVSIREEDFKMTRVDGSTIAYDLVDLNMSKEEAATIYDVFTSKSPHSQFRSFEEAWIRFGSDGPLLEFVYLLTSNKTLKQRLQAQIDNLFRERCPDSWFLLLQLVCFAGQIGCPIILDNVKQEISCSDVFAAIQRLSNEYLVRKSEDGTYVETLHPLRAKIVCDILAEKIGENSTKLMLSTLKCISGNYVQLFLVDFITKHSVTLDIVHEIAEIEQQDWVTCAGLIKTMLWLDVKRYVEQNYGVINSIVKKYGDGWLCFMPLDITGLICPKEFIAEKLVLLQGVRAENARKEIDEIKASFASLEIDYLATDLIIANCKYPSNIPADDNEWSMFGYSLFWFAKRKRKINIPFTAVQMLEKMLYGDIKSRADAVRGILEQGYSGYSDPGIKILLERLTVDYCIVHLTITETEIQCYFVPPVFYDKADNKNENFNHYWRMKVFAILDQLYFEKEHIDVTLTGVNLLQDLGIEAMDYRVRVHKSNRYNIWITEINSWMKSRICYSNRSNLWDDYIIKIDQMRVVASKLVSATISYIEYLYKKQSHNKKRYDRLLESLRVFKQLHFQDILLPKIAVDPYCLYHEGVKTEFSNSVQQDPTTRELSFKLYAKFRKSFKDTFNQLSQFYDQFKEVLLARVEGKTLEHIKNPRLPLINLYDSAKSLWIMQKEYNILFSHYQTLGNDFVEQEIERMLVLVNMWVHVSDNPTKGYAIAYDAKQLYRKSILDIDKFLGEALNPINGRACTIGNKTYILANIDSLSGGFEEGYKNIVLLLRNIYEPARPYNSIRWYFETQTPELIYCFRCPITPLS